MANLIGPVNIRLLVSRSGPAFEVGGGVQLDQNNHEPRD